MKIFFKIWISILTTSLIIILIFEIASYFESKQIFESKGKIELQNIVGSIEEDLNKYINSKKYNLSSLTNITTKLFSKCKVGDNSYCFLLDQNMNFIVHPTLNSSKNLQEIFNHKYSQLCNQMRLNKKGYIKDIEFKSVEKTMYFSTLNNNWKIVIVRDNSLFYNWFNKYMAYMGCIGLLSIFLATYISWYFAKKITNPIKKLTCFSEDLLNGKFGKQIERSKNSNDELNVLTKSLNYTSLHIEKLINNVLEKEKRLKKNIKKLQNLEKINYKLAYFDVVTGLANMNFLNLEFNKSMNKKTKLETKTSFIIVEIGNLRFINEQFSYAGGNKLIKLVATTLKKIVLKYKADIYHVSANKFLVLLHDAHEKENLINISEKILEKFEKPIEINKMKYKKIIIRIGILIPPLGESKIVNIMRRTSIALNKAKMQKQDYYVFDKLSEEELRYEDGFVCEGVLKM